MEVVFAPLLMNKRALLIYRLYWRFLFGLLFATGPMTFAATLPVTNGLSLWLAADVAVTTNATGLVSDWADQSGQGHSASQASASSQPTLRFTQLNGLPSVHFSGGQFFALAGQVLTSPTFSVVAVVKDERNDTNFREVISNWDLNSGNTGSSFFFGTAGLNPVRARFTDNFGGADQGQLGVGTIINPNAYFILTGVSGANSVGVYQNNSNIAFRASPMSPRNLGGSYVVGRQGSGTFDEYWHGDIAELLVFDRELSNPELQLIWTWLAVKYGANFAPPPIQSIAIEGDSARISFAVGLPTNYYLQAISSLASGQWTNIAHFSSSLTVSNAVVADPVTNQTERFYRLLLGP